MTEDTRTETLARATGYPFPAPPHSYLFVNGVAHEIVEPGRDPVHDGRLRDGEGVVPAAELLRRLDIAGAAGLDDRVPVIAHGSNASPEQLARKFADFEGDVVIPVIKAWLDDHDVVYATHLTRYGAIPATLERSPGPSVELAVTFLSAPQLALMHDPEIAAVNYVYGRLDGIRLALDGLGRGAGHELLVGQLLLLAGDETGHLVALALVAGHLGVEIDVPGQIDVDLDPRQTHVGRRSGGLDLRAPAGGRGPGRRFAHFPHRRVAVGVQPTRPQAAG